MADAIVFMTDSIRAASETAQATFRRVGLIDCANVRPGSAGEREA